MFPPVLEQPFNHRIAYRGDPGLPLDILRFSRSFDIVSIWISLWAYWFHRFIDGQKLSGKIKGGGELGNER